MISTKIRCAEHVLRMREMIKLHKVDLDVSGRIIGNTIDLKCRCEGVN
jgi:hypothetical protein